MPNPLLAPLLRFFGRLSYPRLFALTAALFVADVIVPDMGTEQLEGEVHGVLPGLPILYMSGYPQDDILSRGLLKRDRPFLQKPFTGEDLATEVERVIRRA